MIAGEPRRWVVCDHICRDCWGRILRSGERFKCSGCGSEATRCDALCGCGFTLPGLQEKRQAPRQGGRSGRRMAVEVTAPKPAGFRCGPNPNRTTRSPVEIVILLDGKPPSLPAT